MSDEESIEDRQNNELEALKAIYERSLFDLRNENVEDFQPLDIKISLTPSSSSVEEIYVKLDLHVICSEQYPYEAPKILLEDVLGLSENHLTDLENELRTISTTSVSVGEVMIFQLAQHVEEFLYKHNNKDNIKNNKIDNSKHNNPSAESLHDKMDEANRLLEKQLKAKKTEEENRKLQVIMQEIELRQKMLKQNNKKERERRYSVDFHEELDVNHRRSSSHARKYTLSNEANINTLCVFCKPSSVEFRKYGVKVIKCYQCIEHCENIIKLVGVDEESGQLFLVTEWTIATSSDSAIVKKNISSLEDEMGHLVTLKHGNLISYLNIKFELNEAENIMKVYTLQDFIWGLSLKFLYFSDQIPARMPVQIDIVRYLAEGILAALTFLHRNNVFHRNVSAESIYMDKMGTIKISNFSIGKRLGDLFRTSSSSCYSKETDLYNFGLLCLSLIKGSINENNKDIPTNLSRDVQDFLEKCFTNNDNIRRNLPDHPFLKTPISKIDAQLLTKELLIPKEISPETKNYNINLFTSGNNIGQSRFESEFQLLDHIGKGAYGDVHKVQNKLDQQYYAIKRIKLNPKCKQLNKKIVREVKLLSRLNHENVVRYFNSWIETAILNVGNCESQSVSTTSTPSRPSVKKNKEFHIEDSFIEEFAQEVKDNIEWSISYSSKSKPIEHVSSSSSTSSESSDDNFEFTENLDSSSDSNSIEFDHGDDSNCLEKKESQDKVSEDTVDSTFSCTREIQYMYIQMEFCEKSTLRTAIDDKLYLDTNRTSRLFREILEGLAYIHHQGMIHRDLKPMNIFLDFNDHVKIGDFGLATTNLLTKSDIPLSKSNYDTEVRDSQEDPSMTGHIGTALYVAPELTSTAKAVYNQKVDIYSLGIIFFEMCYKPLNTGMERISVINGIRKNNILFPTDFNEKENPNQEIIIRWLLDHDVAKRPTSQELLQSEYTPPPVLEDGELRELVRHTLSNTQLKAYKYVINSCFKQTSTEAQDITYDDTMNTFSVNKNLAYNYIKNVVVKVFELHGGQNLPTPLLMPKSKYYENVETCVRLMTHSGDIVSIPHDLRVPFARYVTRNNITSLRRYSIERVYREKKIDGFIPRELYECAFDIVESHPDLIAEAELLCILNQIVNEIPGLRNKNLYIRINHVLLIQAVFLHCGIKDNSNELLKLLWEAKEGKISKLQVKTHLISYGLSDNSIAALFNLIETEAHINKVMNTFQTITKKKTKASELAKKAFKDLKTLVDNAELFGVKFNILVSPNLLYNVQQYSGLMFQLVCEIKKKHKDVLAAGGRYDGMLTHYRSMRELVNFSNKEAYAVGISLSLDRLVQALEKQDNLENLGNLDVVVCSLGSKLLLEEKSEVLKDLWSLGIKSCLIDAHSMEDIREQCKELGVEHSIILKDSEHGYARIRDKHQEKKHLLSDIAENMSRIIKSSNEGVNDQLNQSLVRSESKTGNMEFNCDIIFKPLLEKLLTTSRKRAYESQIRSQLGADGVFKKIRGELCILAVHLESCAIKTIAGFLEFDAEDERRKSIESIIERHPKHKKYLKEVCEEIYEHKLKKSNCVIILYGLCDTFKNYKVLI